jgi:hypothetical protein
MTLLAPMHRVVFGALNHEPVVLVKGASAHVLGMRHKHDAVWKL